MKKPNTGNRDQGQESRRVAALLLTSVLDNRKPLDALLDTGDQSTPFNRLPPRDRRLTRAIVAAALRHHGEIEVILTRFIEKMPRGAGPLLAILRVAIAQILFMDIADHAAVSIAVTLTGRDPKTRRYKGMANAVLRRVIRERALFARTPEEAARLNTPDWLWERWEAAYGEDACTAIAIAHGHQPGLDLSVRADPAKWTETLAGVVLPTGTVRLPSVGAVSELAGYDDGAWWVQDAAAALPARLLGDVAGLRVADLCAAPGGKTAALANAGARVTAVDNIASRMRRLAANLRRLKLEADQVVADVLTWEPDEAFDAVLLDAPCSATGTIRRHPDVAWLKQPDDIASLAAVQSQMIDRAVAWLKPGGTLVFCTCSLEPEEGEAQAEAAVARHDLTLVPVKLEEIGGVGDMILPSGAVRTLPSQFADPDPRLSGLDGFFIARFRKG